MCCCVSLCRERLERCWPDAARKAGSGGRCSPHWGGALFACLPTLWERAFRHTALTSHYIFLFALYFYLEYRGALCKGPAKLPWQFALLSFWAIGIHPYFLPLVCIILTAVLAVQVWDLSGAAAQKHAMLARDVPIITNNVMMYPEVENLGMWHTQLLSADDETLRPDRVNQLAMLAGREGLATNISVGVSTIYPAAQASQKAFAAQLLRGNYDPQAVYVTTDHSQYVSWEAIYAQDPAVRLFHAYSCYFLWPIPEGV